MCFNPPDPTLYVIASSLNVRAVWVGKGECTVDERDTCLSFPFIQRSLPGALHGWRIYILSPLQCCKGHLQITGRPEEAAVFPFVLLKDIDLCYEVYVHLSYS
jgi:hypothetical protein